MKIVVLLAAVATLAATAGAQTQTPTKTLAGEAKFSLSAVPDSWSGNLPLPKGWLPMDLHSNADPKLPAYPQFDLEQNSGVKVRTLPTYRGQMLQVEAVDSSVGEVLTKVTATFGMRALISPELGEQKLTSAVYRAFSPDDLIDVICEFSVEKWRSSTGVIFFADKPDADFIKELATGRAQEKIRSMIEKNESELRENADPFVFGAPKKVKPLPHWQKRQFNGHEFYYIPGPKLPG